MKKVFLVFFLIVFLGSLFFPLISLAGVYKAKDAAGTEINVCYEGLVPCGLGKPLWQVLDTNETNCRTGTPITTGTQEGISCQFCHFFVMGKGILDFALTLVIIIAVLMFVVGGFMFFFAGADPAKFKTAKDILTSTVKGLVIIFAAWIAVNTFLMFLGVASWTGFFDNPATPDKVEGWFLIDCPITLDTSTTPLPACPEGETRPHATCGGSSSCRTIYSCGISSCFRDSDCPTPPAANAPFASISGPETSLVNVPVWFTVRAQDSDGNLNKIGIYSKRRDDGTWPDRWAGPQQEHSFSAASSWSGKISLTFDSAGTYYVAVNAYDATEPELKCTGNPHIVPPGWSDCDSSPDDGTTDAIIVTVSGDISGSSTACNGDIPYQDNESRYATWNNECDGKLQKWDSGGVGQGCCELACGADSQCDEKGALYNCLSCQYAPPSRTDISGGPTACNLSRPYEFFKERYEDWNGECDGLIQKVDSGGVGQGCCELACGASSYCDEKSSLGECPANCQ